MTTTIFIARDSTAIAVGADGIAAQISAQCDQNQHPVQIARPGSRGMYWAEPLVEVEINGVRHGFGPVTSDAVAGLCDLICPLDRAPIDPKVFKQHPLYLGDLSHHAYLAAQQRLLFARAGLIDALDLTQYERLGGLRGLRRALASNSQSIIDQITESGLRGRGGAAFPAGIKLKAAAEAEGVNKYIVCNADEGDSGTFADRLLMEADPFQIIEGMLIAALATGATRGYVYLRSEYPLTASLFGQALVLAREHGLLGPSIYGSSHSFDIELRIGAGAYICGEETSLLESIEGRRPEVRSKPPLPVHHGLFNSPTVINNVLTLASMTSIMAEGAQAYHDLGAGTSRGTQPFQLAGNIRFGGVVEVPFGVSLRTLIEEFGGGTASGRPIKAVQTGGPLGKYLGVRQLDVPMTYEDLASAGGLLGHGGIVVFDDSVDMAQQARFAMAFCAAESCGKCTPCRIGSVRGVEILDRIKTGKNLEKEIKLLDELCVTMTDASLCAMGSMTPNPVLSALTIGPEDFGLPAGSRHPTES
ncbi:MAG: formate dehydrogenase [Proteobacteria bacterium]|nr:formate dehydrogenase [Pseudomonadota bacterium]